MGRKKTPKKKVHRISDRVEARIVALSLQNPDFGAGRLGPLLQKEKIRVTSSQIYTILKRHNMQTRARRLVKLKKRDAKTTSVPKKKPVKISPEIQAHIVQVSLQHPDYGARRLVPLLAEGKKRLTVSAVNTVLRRNGLSSREKRLAKLAEESSKKSAPAASKKTARITDEVAERIVQVSLQNPDFGAQRLLPLLEKDGILLTASAIYRILKRNGLQNRDKRLARSQAQQSVEALPLETGEPLPDPFLVPPSAEESEWISEPIEPIVPAAAEEPERVPEVIEQKVPPPAAEPHPLPGIIEEQISPPAAEPEQFRPQVVEKTPPPHVPAVSKAREKTRIRGPWFLTFLNLLLLLLLVFLGLYTWQIVRTARLEPEIIAAIPPSPAATAAKLEEAVPSLSSYGMISERNLFNVSREETAAPKKEIEIEKIALAQKDLGLKLVGTVVVDDSKRSVAIIDNRKTREQEAYHEGDQANEVMIKKVMRNKVIIVTKEGDKLLTVEIKETATRSKTSTYARKTHGSSIFEPQIPSQMPAARTSSITLDRQEVASAFEDSEKLLQDVGVAPYLQGDQAAGFRLNRIPPKSILRKMGLRSRDVIVGVNGEAISGPEQAEEFIRTIGEGGEVAITIKRRRRTRQLKLNIE